MLGITGRRALSRRLGSGISHYVSPAPATASASNTSMSRMYHNSPSIVGSFGSRAFRSGSDTFASLSLEFQPLGISRGKKLLPSNGWEMDEFDMLEEGMEHIDDREVSSFRVQSALASMRPFSTGTGNFPVISDPDVKAAFKELMAWGWDDIPDSVISDAKKAIAKSTEDKAGQRALSDVFRAAEASEEFTAILVNIRMGLEERTGLTGEDVTELPEELANAIAVAYNRYIAYVNSFGPDETYLRKKVEAELGTRLIHMKQRVSGLGSEWGDINVIGTSGLSGSYVEQRSL